MSGVRPQVGIEGRVKFWIDPQFDSAFDISDLEVRSRPRPEHGHKEGSRNQQAGVTGVQKAHGQESTCASTRTSARLHERMSAQPLRVHGRTLAWEESWSRMGRRHALMEVMHGGQHDGCTHDQTHGCIGDSRGGGCATIPIMEPQILWRPFWETLPTRGEEMTAIVTAAHVQSPGNVLPKSERKPTKSPRDSNNTRDSPTRIPSFTPGISKIGRPIIAANAQPLPCAVVYLSRSVRTSS